MLQDRAVVCFSVMRREMAAEVGVPSGFRIKIVRYIPGDLVLFGTIRFAVGLLGGRVVIKKAVLTYISCRLSEPFHCP